MAYNQVTPQEQQIAAYYNYMSADPSVAQNPYGTYYGNYGQQQQPQPQLQQTNEWANQWYSQQHQQNYSAPPPRPRGGGGGGFRGGRGRGGYGGDRGFKRPNPNIYNAPAVSYGSSYASTDAPSGVTLPATTIPSGPQPLPASSLKKPPLGKFYCDVCDCYCNDEHAFTLHVNGKKHMNSLRRAGKAPPAPGQHPSQFNQPTPVESKPAKAAKTSSSSTPSGNTGNTRDLTPPPPTAEDILINSKHAELTPVSTSAIAVASIVQATVTVLGTLTDIIEKVHLVGSYTKGVMLRGHTVADVSALLKERPTAAIRSELEQKISSAESLKGEANPSVRSEGGNIYVTDPNGVSVRIMLTWADAMQTTEASTDDISLESCQTALSAVHHAQWFTDRNISLNIRNCIRLMKFYKKSNEPWQSLNPWALEVLVEKTLSLTGTATIARSIRSIFEFISAGALLPGGYGLPDPCTDEESAGVKVDLAASLTPEQRDAITKNAQDTLRAIAFGRWEAVVGKVIKDELVNE